MTIKCNFAGSGDLCRSAAKSGFWTLFCSMFAGIMLIFAATSISQAAELREIFNAHEKNGAQTVDHSAWGAVLEKYLSTDKDGLNRFDYAGMKASGADALGRYLRKLEKTDPSTLTPSEQFAFWTNLYNAKTVEIVTAHYPVASIRDIKLSLNPFAGPWRAKVVHVADQELSLDDIEHKILRPVWKDPRIHYAVNCASVGCPNLLKQPFTGKKLEPMLEQAARAYVNSARGARIQDSKLVVSSLYDWYADDFGRNTTEILAHIRRYADGKLAGRLENTSDIDDYAYDWMLNDRK